MALGTRMTQSDVSEFVCGGDLVLHSGKFKTLEQSRPEVEAIVIRGGRIVFLGSSQDALARADGAEIIDLQGRFALPGFIDSHVHFWRTGLMEQMVNLTKTRTIADIQAAIRERAKQVPKGGLVMGRGWAETALAEQRYPTRKELDEATTDHVV